MRQGNRIDKRITEVSSKGEKILVGLLPYGDPSLEASEKLVEIYLEAGVDIVEFALPSEDPFVDSEQIKESNTRALTNEPDLSKYLFSIKLLRKRYPDEPFEVMAYSDALNKVGVNSFVSGLKQADIDAHLLADSVYQDPGYIKKLDGLLNDESIYRIHFMPHPFRDDLLEEIENSGKGFMILQSIADKNGNRPKVASENKTLVHRVKKTNTSAAIILAYGIRDGQRSREAARTEADGIIVGTTFVELIGKQDYQGLRNKIVEIKQAMN